MISLSWWSINLYQTILLLASGETFVMNKNSLNHPEDNLTSIGFSSNSTYLNDSKTGAAAATEPRDLGWLLEDVNITFYKSLSSM